MGEARNTKGSSNKHSMWQGESVAKQATGEAEAAAARAEGNKPISAEQAAKENAQPSGDPRDWERARGMKDQAPQDDEEEAERAQMLKQQAAKEEHEALARERGHGPHGRL